MVESSVLLVTSGAIVKYSRLVYIYISVVLP